MFWEHTVVTITSFITVIQNIAVFKLCVYSYIKIIYRIYFGIGT